LQRDVDNGSIPGLWPQARRHHPESPGDVQRVGAVASPTIRSAGCTRLYTVGSRAADVSTKVAAPRCLTPPLVVLALLTLVPGGPGARLGGSSWQDEPADPRFGRSWWAPSFRWLTRLQRCRVAGLVGDDGTRGRVLCESLRRLQHRVPQCSSLLQRIDQVALVGGVRGSLRRQKGFRWSFCAQGVRTCRNHGSLTARWRSLGPTACRCSRHARSTGGTCDFSTAHLWPRLVEARMATTMATANELTARLRHPIAVLWRPAEGCAACPWNSSREGWRKTGRTIAPWAKARTTRWAYIRSDKEARAELHVMW